MLFATVCAHLRVDQLQTTYHEAMTAQAVQGDGQGKRSGLPRSRNSGKQPRELTGEHEKDSAAAGEGARTKAASASTRTNTPAGNAGR